MMHLLRYALLAVFTLPTSPDPPAKWVRALPGGVTVELLGVCDPKANPPAWWTPDGKPLAEPIIDTFGADDPRRLPRVFAIRVKGERNPTVNFEYDPTTGGRGGTGMKNREQLDGVHYAAMDLPLDQKSRTIRIKVAATPWKTEVTRPSPGIPEPTARTVSISTPRAVGDETAIVVAEDYLDQDTRLVAIDRDGKRHDNSGGDHLLGKTFRMHDLIFPRLKLETVERFEFQIRPMEMVEFKDVALVPVSP